MEKESRPKALKMGNSPCLPIPIEELDNDEREGLVLYVIQSAGNKERTKIGISRERKDSLKRLTGKEHLNRYITSIPDIETYKFDFMANPSIIEKAFKDRYKDRV